MSSEETAIAGMESALVDLERALGRDRSHVVVTGARRPGPVLLRALAERVPASLRVVRVSLSGGDADPVCCRILRGLGQPPRREPGAQLQVWLRDLAEGGSALALLVDDAGGLSAATLRQLGELAASARPHLRLALFVACERGSEGERVSRLVKALALGVQKISLDTRLDRTPRVAEREPVPVVTPRLAGAAWQVSGTARRSRQPRAMLGAACLLLALALLPNAVERQRSAGAGERERQALPRVEPAHRPTPEPPAAVATAPVAEVRAMRVSAVPAPVPKPASVRRISVNVNARPWARIEVDGRDVGVTPLAGLRLAPGPHRFRARLADGRVIERTVQIEATRDRVSFTGASPD